MNTDKKVLTPEQKERKNELARALRSKKRFEKQVMGGSSPSAEIDEEDTEDMEGSSPSAEIDNEPVDEPVEDPEITRKKAIADKRRASLALARSKIKPKSQITKEKNEEIEKIKEENEKLKDEAEKAKQPQSVAPKVIKKYIIEKPKRSTITPQKQRPQKEPEGRGRQTETINYLAEQSYAEKLQTKLRENMLNRVMYDTFM